MGAVEQKTRYMSATGLRRNYEKNLAQKHYEQRAITKKLSVDCLARILTMEMGACLKESPLDTKKHNYRPEHNTFFERLNRTAIDSVHTKLETAGLDAKYWLKTEPFLALFWTEKSTHPAELS